MRAGNEALIGLDIKKEDEIIDIGSGGVLARIGWQHGGEGVDDESSVVDGDLEGFGDGFCIDPRRGSLDELLFEEG